MELNERQAFVRDQWNAGYSASLIAQKILETTGDKLSRCAVMGMVRRMRLRGIELDKREMAPIMLPPMPKAKWEKVGNVYKRKTAKKEEPVPESRGLSILDLQHDSCRAITGHDERGLARYCGHPRRENSRFSFCEAHARKYILPWDELKNKRR